MAKIETLIDAFDDNSFDSALWNTYVYNGGTVNEQNGRLELKVQNYRSYSQAQVYSASYYTLIASQASVNMSQAPGNQIDSGMSLYKDSNNILYLNWNQGTLYANTLIGGSYVARANVSFAVGANSYLRFREDSGTTYWEYTTDAGESWDELFSMSNPFDLTSLEGIVYINEWSACNAGAGTFYNNFNTLDVTVYAISGVVTKGGTPQAGATVRCIAETTNTTETEQTTDENGAYIFEELDEEETYHICVEYKRLPDFSASAERA